MNKSHSVFLFCFYCMLNITVAFLTPRPPDIEDGYFRGRSGNMILKPIGYQAPDISIVVHDQTGKVLQNTPAKEISIYHVADLIGRSLGISPIHRDFIASDYIQSNFFHRPMANLLIELNSVGDDILSDPNLGINLNYLTSRRHGEIKTSTLKVTGMSYPASSMSLVTSLISGQKPSRHGIIAKEWKTADESIVHGYSSNDPTTWSQAANLPDLITQSFDGQSIIVSLSGDEQHAKVNSVNPTLAGSHPTWTNCYNTHFRPEKMDFIITSQGSNPAIRKVFDDLTAKTLRNMFANQENVLKILETHAGVETNYREGFVSLRYPTKDGVPHYVRYDLTLPEDIMLFAELQSVISLVKVLNSPDATSLIQDNYPDFFSVSFNSVTSLAEKYGKHSTQVVGALYLLDKSIPLILDSFSKLYPNRLLSEVVFLGSQSTSTLSANNPDQERLLSIIERLLPDQEFFEKGLFPSLYIQASDEKKSGEDYCEILNLQLKGEQTGFQIFCLPSRPSLKSLEQQPPVFITQASSMAYQASTDVYYDDIAKYQIVLWISLLMLFTTIYVVYSLAFMSFKKDTIIYSTFNPKWENREAKR